MRKIALFVLCTLLISTVSVSFNFVQVEVKADDPPYVPQPPDLNSSLAVNGTGPDITDWNLSKLIEKHIVPKGYHSMIFSFGQCYGGGMIDEVLKFGNDSHPVFAMSASNYSEESKGNRFENKEPCEKETTIDTGTYSEFCHSFNQALNQYDGKNPATAPTMESAFTTAKKNDPSAPENTDHSPPNDEHPQNQTRGTGANNLKLGNASDAVTRKALLFVGSVDHDRHWNNLNEVHKTLTTKYGFDDTNDIEVLFGNGIGWKDKKALDDGGKIDGKGTMEDLENALKRIAGKMNNTEQFFFWSDDHGDKTQQVKKEPTKIYDPSGHLHFPLQASTIGSMKYAETNVPYIFMVTSNVTTTSNRVYLNGYLLGNLTYTGTGGVFNEILYFDDVIVPLYTLDNTLTIENNQFVTFEVSEVILSTGAIPEMAKVGSTGGTGGGGFVLPVDKIGLLAPYIGSATAIILAAIAAAVYVKRIGNRKVKQ